jgi:hypothetical protein
VQGARRRDHVADGALEPLEDSFVRPVVALAARGSGRPGRVALVAGDTTDRRVGERCQQVLEGVWSEPAVGVGEHDDIAGGVTEPCVEGGRLAAASKVEHQRVGGVPPRKLDGGVGRPVGGDDDLQLPSASLCRQVVELVSDRSGLVVCRDQDGHVTRWKAGRSPRARSQPRSDRQRRRQPDVDGGDTDSRAHDRPFCSLRGHSAFHSGNCTA